MDKVAVGKIVGISAGVSVRARVGDAEGGAMGLDIGEAGTRVGKLDVGEAGRSVGRLDVGGRVAVGATAVGVLAGRTATGVPVGPGVLLPQPERTRTIRSRSKVRYFMGDFPPEVNDD